MQSLPQQIVLSFDIEEHYRIEAAAGLTIAPSSKDHYGGRLEPSTQWLLDELAAREIRATCFIVGQIARSHPHLVRAIHRAGHEVASHSWDHRRLHNLTPDTFREDVRRSMDALEQVTGERVVGYRAPTFSLVRRTSWALDVLAELGLLYDSSIYPVRHDRYGVPTAPRTPFLASGERHTLLELPPLTWRFFGLRLPLGGGGYFRLLPVALLERAIEQTIRDCQPPVAMLYFHPWEFDREQDRLPLGRLSQFRTYVGIPRSQSKLRTLLANHDFVRAVDVAARLADQQAELPRFSLVA
jgi:polysaccharide deacetylase family protein (PEP-CTERM system associated)